MSAWILQMHSSTKSRTFVYQTRGLCLPSHVYEFLSACMRKNTILAKKYYYCLCLRKYLTFSVYEKKLTFSSICLRKTTTKNQFTLITITVLLIVFCLLTVFCDYLYWRLFTVIYCIFYSQIYYFLLFEWWLKKLIHCNYLFY